MGWRVTLLACLMVSACGTPSRDPYTPVPAAVHAPPAVAPANAPPKSLYTYDHSVVADFLAAYSRWEARAEYRRLPVLFIATETGEFAVTVPPEMLLSFCGAEMM